MRLYNVRKLMHRSVKVKTMFIQRHFRKIDIVLNEVSLFTLDYQLRKKKAHPFNLKFDKTEKEIDHRRIILF